MADDQQLMAPEEFAAKIKAKYPQYKDIPDADLVQKIVAKYPQYKSQLKASKIGQGDSLPPKQDGYLKEIATAPVRALKSIGQSIVDSSKERPGEEARGIAYGPLEPAVNVLTHQVDDTIAALERGKAARDAARKSGEGVAGQVLSAAEQYPFIGPLVQHAEKGGPRMFSPQSVGATVEGATYAALPDAAEGAGKLIKRGAEIVKSGAPELAQRIVGSGPSVTNKLVKDYEEAKVGTEEQQSEVSSHNERELEVSTRRGVLDRSVRSGSKSLGEQIVDLDKKVRKLGDEKYATVKQATAKDPGVPLEELSREAKYAEKNILKGSQENIKQFRELIRKAPDAEGVQTSAGFARPGDPLYDQLEAEGALDTGGDIPFDQLQGYSSEIGAKMAKGGLAGDVYQALKYLKEKIDSQKAVIAERNGVGPQLKEADGFWRQYMETFYDKPSAVAAVRERVGKLDPDFYAEPFTKGKAAQTGIGKLEAMATSVPELQKEFGTTASLVKTLRQQHEEFAGLPKKANLKEPVDQPKPPRLEDVTAAKREAVSKTAAQWQQFTKWDARALIASGISSILLPILGHSPLGPAIVAGAETGRLIVGRSLDRPAIAEWLSRPRAADVAILKKLPAEAKTEVANKVNDFIAEERAHGRDIKVDKEAKDALGLLANPHPKIKEAGGDMMEAGRRAYREGQEQGRQQILRKGKNIVNGDDDEIKGQSPE